MHWKVGAGINTVKSLKIEKGGWCMTPSASMVVPPLIRGLELCQTITLQVVSNYKIIYK